MADPETPKPAATSAANTAPKKPAPKKAPAAKSKMAEPKAAAKPKAASKPKTASAKTPARAAPAKGKTEDVKTKVKADMNNFKAKATDGARAAAEKGKDRATEAVSSIGKLIRESAATIDENVGKQYGDYARGAADKVDSFAGKMDAKEVDELVAEARDFVRKSPAVAVGAAAAIGFVLARVFRSGRDDA